jgi:hypothetical protein
MEATHKVATRGSKQEVWNGTAHKTAGGLTKADLVLSKGGKPVSKKQSEAAAARYPAMVAAMVAKHGGKPS